MAADSEPGAEPPAISAAPACETVKLELRASAATSSLGGSGTYDGVAITEVLVAAIDVPEPSTLALLVLGGGALAGWRRWRKRAAA